VVAGLGRADLTDFVGISTAPTLGYQVRTAGDAEAALAILDTDYALDLLFTDVVMPGTLSGFDLAERATLRVRASRCC
jgi:CheY-like chemotaxis protein